MELKNAVAVCLISLFSATIVVLIARSLDSQAASQLEPQLTAIVEELQALRKQGGLASLPTAAARREPADDRLAIYFFHATQRCANCEAVESAMEELLRTDFAAPYNRGEIAWKLLDYEKPSGARLAGRFKVAGLAVILARVKDNQLQEGWKNLGNVMALTGDKPALAAYLRGEIQQMLAGDKPPTPPPGGSGRPAIPVPATKTTDPAAFPKPPAIPVPE
jgi:hypothetical protein